MPTQTTLTCPQCQQHFDFIPTNNRRKYCSYKCKRRANQLAEDAESRKRYLNSPKGKAMKKRKAERYEQSERGQTKYRSRLLEKRLHTANNRKPCLVCFEPIPVGKQKFCGRECRQFNRLLFDLPKTAMVRKCLQCGSDSHFRQKYCSKKCQQKAVRQTEKSKITRRAASRRRRARKRNVFHQTVYLEIVAKRDNYKCHICRKQVKMDLHVLDNQAPTLDHLIPLSLGGDHTYANIRLAHRICNSKKGNRAINEQLMLFG